MTAELARIGGAVGCVGLGTLLLAARPQVRLAGLAACALGGALLVPYLAPAGRSLLLALAAAAGLALAAALAAVLRRWPWVLAPAALACVPARIPVEVGTTSANLLLPLYLVVAAAALLLAYELWRGDERSRELGALRWPLAAFVAWTGLSLVWTNDLRQGAIELLFFYLPFGLLAVSVARLPWRRSSLVALYGVLAALALVFAAVGVYQWLAHDVFWNPKVIVGNAYAPFYRVNSLFWDPSIYGRFLVVAILVSLAVVLFGAGRRAALLAAAAIAATWLGLVLSFSQSSFVALVAGVMAAAALVWRWRAAAALGLAAAVALSVGFSTPNVRHRLIDENGGLNRASSGRTELMEKGVRIVLDHPVAGVGIGAFRRAYAEEVGTRRGTPARGISHNTPITVAAETGLPGFLLYAWLLVAALGLALRRAGRTLLGRTSLACFLALTAIAVHSLFYNAFFEDPMTWGLFALVAVAATATARSDVLAGSSEPQSRS